MFTARVSPKKEKRKRFPPTDARETTQESVAPLRELLTYLFGKIQTNWILSIVGPSGVGIATIRRTMVFFEESCCAVRWV